MKNMKHNICVWSILLTIIALSSCEDKFLDRKPDNTLDEEAVYSDYTRASGVVTGLYNRLRGRDRGCVMLNHFSLSCLTDECKASTVEQDLANRITQGQWGPSTTNQFQYYWWEFYQSVHECNRFIECVEKYKTPDNPKRAGDLQVRVGEAYFLRVYWHWNILRFYGDMVYMDKTADLNDEATLKSYAKISGVDAIDKMIVDLDEAIQRLPVNQPDVEFGRVEKGTAMAFKARLLFVRAMPMWNGGGPEGLVLTGDTRVDKDKYATYDPSWWKKAADAAKEVMDLKMNNGQPRYHLFTRFTNQDLTAGSLSQNPEKSNVNHRVYQRIMKLFWDFDAFQNEFIMILTRNKPQGWQTDQTPPSNQGAARSMPLQDQVDEYEFIGSDGRGYPIYHPNAAAMGYDDSDPYRNRDPRFYAHFTYFGSTFQTTTDPLITERSGSSPDRIGANNASVTGYYLRKCLQDDWIRGTGNWDNHWPLIRLPEVILIYCEAMCQHAGPSAEIVNLLNELRTRSFMAPIPDGLNKEELLEYILRERRVELFYENVRWFDVRWRLEPSNPKEIAKQAAYDALTSDQAKANFYPYPRTQKQIHGMEPIRDPAGKIEVDGVKYRMQRYRIENRVFNIPQTYFVPIIQSEISNMPTIIQNPGW